MLCKLIVRQRGLEIVAVIVGHPGKSFMLRRGKFLHGFNREIAVDKQVDQIHQTCRDCSKSKVSSCITKAMRKQMTGLTQCRSKVCAALTAARIVISINARQLATGTSKDRCLRVTARVEAAIVPPSLMTAHQTLRAVGTEAKPQLGAASTTEAPAEVDPNKDKEFTVRTPISTMGSGWCCGTSHIRATCHAAGLDDQGSDANAIALELFGADCIRIAFRWGQGSMKRAFC
jgi:Fe-S-cluster-containing dehydrogenase component